MRSSSAHLSEDVTTVLHASRALIGVAARSLSELPDSVTLQQFRTLVVLSSRGPQPIGTLAEDLALHPSSGTRLVDRLARKRLVRRVRPSDPEADRRQAMVELTPTGAALVDKVTQRRRRDLTRILGSVPDRERRAIAAAMEQFAFAAGTLVESSWKLGWGD